MGFASQRRHLLPPPHTRRPAARSFCGGVTAFPREGETAPRTESLQCSTERCKKGRRVWQTCGMMGGQGGGSGSSVSKVSCPWEAKDCGGSAHVSPPAPLPSSRRLSPPPPAVLSSSFPLAVGPSPSVPPRPTRLGFAPSLCSVPQSGYGRVDGELLCGGFVQLHSELPWLSFRCPRVLQTRGFRPGSQ